MKTIFNTKSTARLIFKAFTSIISLLILLSMPSCSENGPDIVTGDDNDDFEEVTEIESDGEVCTMNAANIASSMPNFIKQQIDSRFVSLSSTIDTSTKVVFASASELSDARQTLLEAYGNGATIVLVDTEESVVAQWLAANGIASLTADTDGSDHDHLIYAFNNRHRYYYFDDFADSDCEDELDFFPVRFDSVVGWLNKYAVDDDADTQACSRADGDYDIARTFGNQVVTHNYAVELKDKTLAHVIASSADKLSRTSSIDVTLTIYPLYSPASNGTSHGDYYIVKGYVNAHNGAMYKEPWTKKHGGVKAHLCGFYMSKLDVGVNIRATNATFPVGGTPVPQTTASATTYTSGFSWSISGNILGKVESGTQGVNAGVTGSCSWNNSETRTLPDVSIKRDTHGGDIQWSYSFNNLPHKSSYEIPDLAKSDFETNFSWIWWIPGDPPRGYGKHEYAGSFTVNPTYQSYHWYSSSADFSTSDWDDGISHRTFTIILKHPERHGADIN